MKKLLFVLLIGISGTFFLQSCAVQGESKLHEDSGISTVSFIEKQQVAINKANKKSKLKEE